MDEKKSNLDPRMNVRAKPNQQLRTDSKERGKRILTLADLVRSVVRADHVKSIERA